ncbi:hypothetical protein SOM10_06390 [Microbacterium sp. CFBP9023]|uniref:hypothetical protein n=1 Tax=Microbacterium sp. CFBP9023 TaxID=3096535 RepID=UPI002A6A9BE5|nr:hypothetical protein [Microbacterium sp. CFBP9023]MDY0983513.1 hypothetical protein [Microbacterium sp. CFBP9023]
MSEPQQPPAQPHGTPPDYAGSHYPAQPAPQPTPQPTQPQHAPHDGQPHAGQPYPGQQHAGQPYAGQPYAGQTYAGQPYPVEQRPAQPGAGLGRTAFLLALVSLAIGLVVTLSYPLMFRMTGDPFAIGAFSAIGNGLVLVVAVVGLILGLMSVRRPGPKILAGIAIGVTASQLVGIVISWVSNLFYALPF